MYFPGNIGAAPMMPYEDSFLGLSQQGDHPHRDVYVERGHAVWPRERRRCGCYAIGALSRRGAFP